MSTWAHTHKSTNLNLTSRTAEFIAIINTNPTANFTRIFTSIRSHDSTNDLWNTQVSDLIASPMATARPAEPNSTSDPTRHRRNGSMPHGWHQNASGCPQGCDSWNVALAGAFAHRKGFPARYRAAADSSQGQAPTARNRAETQGDRWPAAVGPDEH